MCPDPSARRHRHVRRLHLLVGLLAALGALIPGAGPAHAHTEFESSTPADGDVVTRPLRTVTIVFTNPATPVGDGFVALDGDGRRRTPDAVETTDDRVFDLRFRPPLAGGRIGVRWNVRAGDAHPIEGSFSFTIDAPATAIDAPATTAPPTTALSAAGAAAETAAPPTSGAGPTTTAGTSGAASDDADDDALQEFLAVDGGRPGETTGLAGRVVGLLGVVLAIGLLGFAATALRGTRTEVLGVLTAARAAGLVVAVGALVEYVGLVQDEANAVGAAWRTTPGLAMTLRLLGGLVLALGVRSTFRADVGHRAQALSAAVVEAPAPSAPTTAAAPGRWQSDTSAWAALAGIALLLTSFWFDGHTVSEGPRALHALVASVHVAAGSLWVGGVAGMAAIVWWRARARRPVRGAELVLRFSRVATLALGAVLVAGGLLALFVLDSLDELTGTEWGQILMLKSSAVLVAALLGAYNHFRLLPAYEADPDAPGLDERLRSTLAAEAILLAFVVVVTAWLVAAAV